MTERERERERKSLVIPRPLRWHHPGPGIGKPPVKLQSDLDFIIFRFAALWRKCMFLLEALQSWPQILKFHPAWQ